MSRGRNFPAQARSRDYLVETLISATDGLAWGIQNLARDAPEPMQTALTEAVAHLDDTFGHLRESLICSAKRDIAAPDAGELDRRLRHAIPLPGRAQALRARNARSAPLPARIAAADFPYSAAGCCRDAVPRDGSGGRPRRCAAAAITPTRAEGKPWTSPITSG